MRSTVHVTPTRWAMLLVLLATVAPAVLVAAMATGLPWGVAVLITAIASVVAGRAAAPLLPANVMGSRMSRTALLLLWMALGLFAAYRIASLSVFMQDVQRANYAFGPAIRELDDPEMAKPFFPEHNCFTCYIVAAHLASTHVDNIYDRKHYRRAEIKTPIHEQIGDALHVDTYQYPPPFLILPRLLLATGGDFYQLRAYWFGVNVIALVAAMVVLFRWIGEPALTVRWLALPALLASPVTLATLQIQNAHLLMILISVLALPAFRRRWYWLGGALLGFAIVSKLFPVLLLAFLLVQRRWRAVCWTGGWMIAYGVLALLLFGSRPYEAFLSYQMPRLASGEAFSFAWTYITALVKNGSVFGLAYKLEKLGLLSDAASLGRVLVWIYSAVMVVVLLLVGRRRYNWTGGVDDHASQAGGRLVLARVWLALLILGQLRSPFLPWVYGNVPILLLLLLLVPIYRETTARGLKIGLVISAWATVAVIIPLPFGPPAITVDLIHTLVALLVALVCCAVAVWPRPSAAGP